MQILQLVAPTQDEPRLQDDQRPLTIRSAGIYRGPNAYALIPLIRIEVDLGGLEHWPTDRLDGFAAALLDLLPGLRAHGCCFGTPGGFVRRLEEGTWLGHVAEHVALELQIMVGYEVSRGKTRSVPDEPGVYRVMYAFRDETVGLYAGQLAFSLIDSLLPVSLRGVTGLDAIAPVPDGLHDGPFNVAKAIGFLRAEAQDHALGPSTQALVDEAVRRGLPVLRLDDRSFVQIGHGKHQRRIRAALTSETGALAVDIAGDKQLTRMLLQRAAIPTPRGRVVQTEDEAAGAADSLGYPVVVKPLDANQGRGVSVGLTSAADVRAAFVRAQQIRSRVIVEEHFTGRDYRILVVDGAVVAVAERVPAHVIGDGVGTIAALIAAANADPRRGFGHEAALTRIDVDPEVTARLANAGLTLDSVPAAGQAVYLRATANLSTGGTAIDRTDEIHPATAALACRAAGQVGLDVAGIDLIAPDIREELGRGAGIVEVNASPGLRMHLSPSVGRARNVAAPILDMLFPPGPAYRLPIFAITGTNGKSTTARMLGHILRRAGRVVGMTSTSGIFIDGVRIAGGDATGPRSARTVLADPTIDAAVLETARGGLLREGLGFETCDVGAVLNVQADHLGLKGVKTIEDMAWVKSVVVEAVHPDGCAVLNADDPHTLAMMDRAGVCVILFSMHGDDMPLAVARHIAGGGRAVMFHETSGYMFLHALSERRSIIKAAEIPATLDGLATCNIENSLAAAAMAIGGGLPIADVRDGLGSFSTDYEHNPGRLNVVERYGVRIILDYAHNPAGLRHMCRLAAGLRRKPGRIIATVSIPGDRGDAHIREMGEIAANTFDVLVFRETPDRRGRAPGEIAALMREGALASGFPADRIHCVLEESAAVDASLRMATAGDVVVLLVTSVEEGWRQVQTFTGRERAP